MPRTPVRGRFSLLWSTVDMADGSLTATAEAPLTQAQEPGTFWEYMRDAEDKLRQAWITGSAPFADKERARRLLDQAIARLENAKALLP